MINALFPAWVEQTTHGNNHLGHLKCSASHDRDKSSFGCLALVSFATEYDTSWGPFY